MLYIALLVAVAIAAFFAGAHNAKRAASLKDAALKAKDAVSKK
jgi:hypothetical protein